MGFWSRLFGKKEPVDPVHDKLGGRFRYEPDGVTKYFIDD